MTSLLESEGSREKEIQAELDRLARLRRNVANGLMALSESARRDATALLSLGADGPSSPTERTPSDDDVRAGFALWQVASAFLVGLTCGLAVMWYVAPGVVSAQRPVEALGSTMAESHDARKDETGPVEPADSVPASEPDPIALPELVDETGTPPPVVAGDRLVVALSASRTCWVRTAVDGSEPVERTLRAGDVVALEAESEVSLRVGDAGAVALAIDGQPARPLGGDGQVVTTSITRANLATFLGD